MIASSDTGFVVVWRSDDGSGPGVFGRRFDGAGTAPASEVRINANIAFGQSAPDRRRAGRFIPGGVGHRGGGGTPPRRPGLPGRARCSASTPTRSDYQIRPSVARLAGSGFVVVWISEEQDGSSYGIFGRRVAVLADLDVDGNGVVDPLTDGLLGLRYMFGFRGATLITGAVGAGCTRCTAPAIEAYLAGKV